MQVWQSVEIITAFVVGPVVQNLEEMKEQNRMSNFKQIFKPPTHTNTGEEHTQSGGMIRACVVTCPLQQQTESYQHIVFLQQLFQTQSIYGVPIHIWSIYRN